MTSQLLSLGPLGGSTLWRTMKKARLAPLPCSSLIQQGVGLVLKTLLQLLPHLLPRPSCLSSGSLGAAPSGCRRWYSQKGGRSRRSRGKQPREGAILWTVAWREAPPWSCRNECSGVGVTPQSCPKQRTGSWDLILPAFRNQLRTNWEDRSSQPFYLPM